MEGEGRGSPGDLLGWCLWPPLHLGPSLLPGGWWGHGATREGPAGRGSATWAHAGRGATGLVLVGEGAGA